MAIPMAMAIGIPIGIGLSLSRGRAEERGEQRQSRARGEWECGVVCRLASIAAVKNQSESLKLPMNLNDEHKRLGVLDIKWPKFTGIKCLFLKNPMAEKI